MRKIYKIVGSMLAIGVLIAGIGSGVAFAEYSAFEYGGETVLEGSERFTKTLKYKVSVNGDTSKETEESEEITEVSSEETEREAETSNTEKVEEYKQDKAAEGKKVLGIALDHFYTVIEDPSVPKNMVYFEISYLSDNQDVKPEIITQYLMGTEEFIHVDCGFQYNDFRALIRAKDLILSDLKNHKISEYQIDRIESIEVQVNPEADFDLSINGDRFENDY